MITERIIFCICSIFAYILLIPLYVYAFSKNINIQYKKKYTVYIHMIGGILELLLGAFLLYYSFFDTYIIIKYIFASIVLFIHVPTTFMLIHQVMGLKRISQPSYFCVGMLLFYYSIKFLINISDYETFLQLFSLVLMAVWVRYSVLLCNIFSLMDGHEYTFGIIIAGTVTLSVVMGTFGIFIVCACVIIWNIVLSIYLKYNNMHISFLKDQETESQARYMKVVSIIPKVQQLKKNNKL